jgi:hypothetical protein
MSLKRGLAVLALLAVLACANWAVTSTITYITVILPTNLLRMDPQQSPGTIVRFTAPVASSHYSVTGLFQGIDTVQSATNLYVYSNGSQVWTNTMPQGGYGTQRPISLTNLTLAAGQTVDFIVVTQGIRAYLSVGLQATITDGLGGSYDVIGNFNPANAPSGVFTYGSGGTPQTFVLMPNIYTVNCLGVSTGTVCMDNGQPAYTTSQVSYYNPTAAVSTVPTLSHWGLILLAVLLLGLSSILLRQAVTRT